MVVFSSPEAARHALLSLYDELRVDDRVCASITFATEDILDRIADPALSTRSVIFFLLEGGFFLDSGPLWGILSFLLHPP